MISPMLLGVVTGRGKREREGMVSSSRRPETAKRKRFYAHKPSLHLEVLPLLHSPIRVLGRVPRLSLVPSLDNLSTLSVVSEPSSPRDKTLIRLVGDVSSRSRLRSLPRLGRSLVVVSLKGSVTDSTTGGKDEFEGLRIVADLVRVREGGGRGVGRFAVRVGSRLVVVVGSLLHDDLGFLSIVGPVLVLGVHVLVLPFLVDRSDGLDGSSSTVTTFGRVGVRGSEVVVLGEFHSSGLGVVGELKGTKEGNRKDAS